MTKIEELQNNPTKHSIHISDGPVEADPEYVLIVDANNLAVEIDNEICMFYRVETNISHIPVAENLIFSFLQL